MVDTIQPIECGSHILLLTEALVKAAGTQADPAEVEAKNRNPKAGERLHRVVNDFGVHSPTGWRVWMTENGRERRIGSAGIQEGLKPACGTEEIVDLTKMRCTAYDRSPYVLGHDLSVRGTRRKIEACAGPYQVDGLTYADRMEIDPIALTRRLVDIESTTYHEGPAGDFLAEYLQRLGYSVERQPVCQPDPASTPGCGGGDRFNIYARPPGSVPLVTFSTHMDTVPPYFPSSEDADYLYGRGSCDAKGIIAAQIAAAGRLQDQDVATGLLFLVGEERDSAGAAEANQHPKGSRYLINGEPTDNRLALASKGALRVELRARGRMAHSAYPELGESAIDKLVAVLHDLQSMTLPVDPLVGDSTLNVGLISGGRAPNVIADQAEAHLLIRLVGPSEGTREQLRRIVGDRADVAFSLDLPFVRMREIDGLPTMIAKFTTDIPSLTAWGEPFLLGPGSIHVAHTPDERLAKRELLEAVSLYVSLVHRLVHE